MKILAIEKDVPGITPAQFKPYLRDEALRVWELYQAGLIRELYFRQETPNAVLVLECASAAEAGRVLDSLPLVEAGLIAFELLPLIPYPGFARLFGPEKSPAAGE